MAGDDCPASCGGRLYDLQEPTATADHGHQRSFGSRFWFL